MIPKEEQKHTDLLPVDSAFGSPDSPMYSQRIWLEIINHLIWLLDDDAGLEECEDKTCQAHLHWMLVQMLYMSGDQGKRNRWLGYIQGVMASQGMLDVNAERDRTRPLFAALARKADCHEELVWKQLSETLPPDAEQVLFYSEKYDRVTTGVWSHYKHHNEPRFTKWMSFPLPSTGD